MGRRFRLVFLLAVCGMLIPASAVEYIRIGTLASKTGTCGPIFAAWNKLVREKSEEQLELQFFFDGTAGDEKAMIEKIRKGQLDGAALTGAGLGQIYAPILALQLPGQFTGWTHLDKVRDRFKNDFNAGLGKEGFTLLGYSDFGVMRLYSKGVSINLPAELSSAKFYVQNDNPIMPIFRENANISNVTVGSITQILPNLNSNTCNAVLASAIMTEQLHLTGKFTHVNDTPVAYEIGGIVISSKRFNSLPAAQQTILTDTAKTAADIFTTKMRIEDAATYAKQRGVMTVNTPNADTLKQWAALFEKTRTASVEKLFLPAFTERWTQFGK